jgi:putative hydrolase of the HAD superfamily
MIQIVGVDADDTLWDEVSAFDQAENRFVNAMTSWTGDRDVRENLRALHFALIDRVGYGPAGYRAALGRFCDDRLPPQLQARALDLVQAVCDDLDRAIVTPLPGVERALDRLSRRFHLMLLSKGDEGHQRRKLDASDLGWAFHDVRIVREKTALVYREAFGDAPAAMIGNSLKSDILPALEAGAFGLYVPFHRTSPLEQADPPVGHDRFREFGSLRDAADWLCAFSSEKRGR